MKIKMIICMCVMCIVMMAMTGCTTFRQLTGTQPYPECNNNISDDSLLKKIAIAHEICLEDVGNALIITNAWAINRGLYTREQAQKVVSDWIALLENGVTYKEFRDEVYKQTKAFPGLFEIGDIYLLHFSKANISVLSADREMLLGWLNNRVMPLLQEVE